MLEIKVIIDTSWWISFILSKHSGGFPAFFDNRTVKIYFSHLLLNEIHDTLNYGRSRKRFNEKNYKQFLSFIDQSAAIIESTSEIDICRDPKDNFLLALAKDAGADYLITRDDDLLVLKKFEHTIILTLHQFTEILNQQSK